MQRTNSLEFCSFKLCRIRHKKGSGATEPRVITELSPRAHLRLVSEHSLWARPIPLTPKHDQVVT